MRYYISSASHPQLVVTDAMQWGFSRANEPKIFPTFAAAEGAAVTMDVLGFSPVIHFLENQTRGSNDA